MAGHGLQCDAESPNRTLVKRYSKAVQSAVQVARQVADQQISNYDLAVQMMNNLAVNAMGGYEEYEDLQTGGRIWYLSNMPITKTGGVCSFEPNSTVFKMSGSGFFVSRDGGITWVNGYAISTGELVVNVLDAIGINFDWARGGTLTLGGYGNGNGVMSIQDSSNVEKVHGDNTGIIVGANTGSKIHMTTTGHLDYYYDNTYSGVVEMNARNYSQTSTPDLHDTFEIKQFDDIRVSSSSDYTVLTLHNNNATGAYTGDGARLESSGDITVDGDDVNIFSASETRIDAGGKLELDATDGIVFGSAGLGSVPTIYPNGYSGQNDPTAISSDVIRISNGTQYSDWQVFNGMLCSITGTGTVPHSYWHTWESGATTYDSIILATGTTTATFPDIDTSLAYFPYISCADNVEPPVLEGIKFNGTSCVVRFTAVTSAQVGTGSECVIKLLATIA